MCARFAAYVHAKGQGDSAESPLRILWHSAGEAHLAPTSTKIGARYLEAQTRPVRLPAGRGFYNTSSIRQYARAVEYDEADLLELYGRHA
jgi:hypothetical protein